ncbi:MAG: homocysteine S-methyltransferase family protein [Clostridiales Family XIII bacterium]|jgi:5-methyltetrahydrofolate--homocysteine methyltransferase|nr:homocysteine S-methyltransferase family protein [Clostridiales Family XIII bacterium]
MVNTDILNKKILLLDSAMGSALIAAGALPAGEGSENANLISPAIVEEIHRRNIDAGCDIVTANTFGAHIGVNLRKDSDPALAEEALHAGVRLARKAVDGSAARIAPDRKIYVALDIGPIGDIIGLTSSLTHDDATEVFARMAGAGAAEGADLVLIETMSDLAEAIDAITAAKAETDLPVFCSMTFGEKGKTFMGVSVEAFVEAAVAAGADAVGCNCSLGPDGMLPVAQALIGAAGDIPVLVQPNAGQPLVKENEVYYDMTPEVFADGMSAMIEAGARIAGGCCGTTPEMIALLKKRITLLEERIA